MIPEGESILYRIEIHALKEYGAAVARMEQELRKSRPQFNGREPFEYVAWAQAVQILYRLRKGCMIVQSSERKPNV
jgi:hypothetical protein